MKTKPEHLFNRILPHPAKRYILRSQPHTALQNDSNATATIPQRRSRRSNVQLAATSSQQPTTNETRWKLFIAAGEVLIHYK